jgi:hypothetical protein
MRLLSAACLVVGFGVMAWAATPETIQSRAIACQPREYMVRAVTLIDQKDFEAADTLFERGRLTGACRAFNKGDSVIREEREFQSGLSKIHKVGDPTAYWIINQDVDPR